MVGTLIKTNFITNKVKITFSAFKSCHVNGGYGEKSSLEHVFTQFHGMAFNILYFSFCPWQDFNY